MLTPVRFTLCLAIGLTLTAGSSLSLQAQGLPEFTTLVKSNGPAVVNITTTRKPPEKSEEEAISGLPNQEELFDDLMKRFFGEGIEGMPPDSGEARGSGFVLSADGYIVTNHHVVQGAEEIAVKLNDRREFPAKLLGSDQRSDIALLKIEASALPTLKMGDSSQIEVGEWVLAIGSPFGFESSATSGIVSATGRSLPNDSYVPFIQTDVAINPGNSGGPLFNLKGEVVGINSQIYSRSGGFMGVSFAIPVNMALDVIAQLKEKGKVSRGWIGVYIQEVDQALAQSFGMSTPTGALVSQLFPDGPAMNVLKEGDVITAFDGKSVSSAAALPSIVGSSLPKQRVKLSILRDKQVQTVEMVVGEMPSEESPEGTPLTQEEAAKAKPVDVLGMQVLPLDDETRALLGLVRGGVLVDSVRADPAQRAGLKPGDVLSMLDGKGLESPQQMADLAKGLEKGRIVAILVHREGSQRFLAMRVE